MNSRIVTLWDIVKNLSPIGHDIAEKSLMWEFWEQSLDKRVEEKGSGSALDEWGEKGIDKFVSSVGVFSIGLLLTHTAQAAADFKVHLVMHKPMAVGAVRERLKTLRESFFRELKMVQFIQATPDMIEYLDKPQPFGKYVEKAFPDCSDDLAEAYQCFAFERYTASMFHLGRAMELATKKFGKKIRAVTPGRDEWQPWLTTINAVISAMPFKAPKEKAKRECLTEAAAHFFNFKESFRNKTMHPEKSYTREQALKSLEGAQAFLDGLAQRVFKVKV
jgi:hypothetical protein